MLPGTDKAEVDEGGDCSRAREAGYADFRPIHNNVNPQAGTCQGPGHELALSDAAGTQDIDNERCLFFSKLTATLTFSADSAGRDRAGGSACHPSGDHGEQDQHAATKRPAEHEMDKCHEASPLCCFVFRRRELADCF